MTAEWDEAIRLLNVKLNDQRCSFCRSHIQTVIDEVQSLKQLDEFSQQLHGNPELLVALRKIGIRAQEIHLLSMLTILSSNRFVRFLMRYL